MNNSRQSANQPYTDTASSAGRNGTRNHLIDAYRGLTMISMVLYHACYDYFIIFQKDYAWLTSRITYLWQQSICISFITVSGLVWRYGRRRALKRGLTLIALGTLITFTTMILMPGEAIHYGILTFMGIATLFMIPYNRLNLLITENTDNSKFGKNTAAPTELLLCLLYVILFAITKHFPNGYIGSRFNVLLRLPDSLYKYDAFVPFGFPPSDFKSADYFPVIPWIFMYLFGYHAGKVLLDNPVFAKLGTRRLPFMSWLGTKSLLVYIIHQPICFGIVWLICR